MKKLFSILTFLVLTILVKAQYPVNQFIGSDSALVTSKGGLKGRFVNFVFEDTTAANLQRIRQYPGAMIYTYKLPSDSGSIWLRNGVATKWLRGSGAIDITSITFDNDTTGIICFSNGVCDTFNIVNNAFVTFNYLDSTLTVFGDSITNVLFNYVDSSISVINNISNGCNSLIQPGYVTWSGSGMLFNVTNGIATINCVTFPFDSASVTLANGGAQDRFDVIYVDTSGVIGVLQGDEAVDPQIPQLDPASQLELTVVLVTAGATTPTTVELKIIYNENLGPPVEATTAQNNWTTTTPANFNSTAFPYVGTKNIFVSNSGAVNSTSFLRFTFPDTLLATDGWEFLKLYVSLNTALSANQGFSFQFAFNGSPVSNVVNILPGVFTFSNTVTSAYQGLVLPMSLFIFSDTAYNDLFIKPINGTKNFYMDYIQMQKGNNSGEGTFDDDIHNQFIGPQLANYWIGGRAKIEGGLTVPNINFNGSERIGLNSIGNGTEATVYGYYAFGLGNDVTVVGSQSSTASGSNFGHLTISSGISNSNIGGSSSINGNSNLLFAINGVTTGSQNVGAGQNLTITGSNNVTAGYSNTLTSSFISSLGSFQTVGFGSTITLGAYATPTAVNQFIVGGTDGFTNYGVTQMWLGNGVTTSLAQDIFFGITGEVGTDQSGHTLTIAGGKGTGNASTGSIIDFQTSDATGSGATLQTLTTKLRLLQSGQVRALNYGDGTFTGTATYIIASDVNGNLIEYPPGGLGGNGLLFARDDDANLTGNDMYFNNFGDVMTWDNTTINFYNNTFNVFDYATSTTRLTIGQTITQIYSPNQNGVITIADNLLEILQTGDIDIQASGAGGDIQIGSTLDDIAISAGKKLALDGVDSVTMTVLSVGSTSDRILIQRSSVGSNRIGYVAASNFTYTASEGLTMTANDVTLGGTVTTDRTLTLADNTILITANTLAGDPALSITSTSTAAASSLQKGLNISLSGANSNASQTTYGLYVSNTHTGSGSTNYAAYFTSSGGSTSSGIRSAGTTGVGVYSESTLNDGLFATSAGTAFAAIRASGTSSADGLIVTAISGTGATITSTSGLATVIRTNPSSTNTQVEVLRIDRQTSGTSASGIGGIISYYLEDDGGDGNVSTELLSTLTTVSAGNEDAQFKIRNKNGGVLVDVISFEGNKRTILYGRLEQQQGADVASVAGAIAVGLDGNVFELTGTNAVTLISNLNWVNGSVIYLVFTSTATLTDGTANSGTDIGMELAGGANFTGSADDVICLILTEVGAVQRWREVSRSVN